MNTISITSTYTKQTIIEEEVHETHELKVGGLYYTENSQRVAFISFVPEVGFLVTDVNGSGWGHYYNKLTRDYNYKEGKYEEERLENRYCGTDKTGLRFVRTLYFDSAKENIVATFKINKKPIKIYKKKNNKEGE